MKLYQQEKLLKRLFELMDMNLPKMENQHNKGGSYGLEY
jgi:hypothetical protein